MITMLNLYFFDKIIGGKENMTAILDNEFNAYSYAYPKTEHKKLRCVLQYLKDHNCSLDAVLVEWYMSKGVIET